MLDRNENTSFDFISARGNAFRFKGGDFCGIGSSVVQFGGAGTSSRLLLSEAFLLALKI